MVEWINAQAHEHFQWVLIGLGALVMVGSALNWRWMTDMPVSNLWGTRKTIEEVHGEKARYFFERCFTFLMGLVLVLFGAVAFFLY